MEEQRDEPGDRAKKERSPSFPFIPLRKAVERAQAFYDAHRKEAARIQAIADTWHYGVKSSGLLQTVAALKQFGLAEDFGSGDDRKVRLTPLALGLLVDAREGAREQAIAEAAKRPRLLAEYLETWLPRRPSDAHCISELQLDRGFSLEAAKLFLRVFDDTVSFARLDTESAESSTVDEPEIIETLAPLQTVSDPRVSKGSLLERMQVLVTGSRLVVTAQIHSTSEVDRLIRILEANKALLEDAPSDDTY